MAKLLKWRGKQIAARPARILRAYGPVIGEELQDQMQLEQFYWPKRTLRFQSKFMEGKPGRRGGVIIEPGERDVVDTGNLMDSQTPAQITVKGGRLLFNIKWEAEYSGDVLRGGDYSTFPQLPYINPDGEEVELGKRPGRDWITPALQQQPFKPFFFREWKKLSRS